MAMADISDINISVLGDSFALGVGDSSMKGWAGLLMQQTQKNLGNIHYYNLAVVNETSIACCARIKELVPRAPKGQDNRLILSFGLADTEIVEGKPRVSNQDSVEALKILVGKTRSHFKMLMIGLPPVYDPQRNSRVKRLNALYRELCQKSRVPFVDIYSTLAEDVQYKRELVKSGKVLPAQTGYEKIFDLIWNDRAWWFNP